MARAGAAIVKVENGMAAKDALPAVDDRMIECPQPTRICGLSCPPRKPKELVAPRPINPFTAF